MCAYWIVCHQASVHWSRRMERGPSWYRQPWCCGDKCQALLALTQPQPLINLECLTCSSVCPVMAWCWANLATARPVLSRLTADCHPARAPHPWGERRERGTSCIKGTARRGQPNEVHSVISLHYVRCKQHQKHSIMNRN